MDGMNDMVGEPTTGPLTTGPQTNEQCVPLDALGMPDDTDQMAAPEVGDVVSYTVEGKVTRVQGGQAYVMPESVNGKPIGQPDDGGLKPAVGPEEELQGAMAGKGYL